MTTQVREQVHQAVDQLPETQLPEVLRLLELLATTPPDADMDVHEQAHAATDDETPDPDPLVGLIGLLDEFTDP